MEDKGRFKFRPRRPTDVRAISGAHASILGRPTVAWILAFGPVVLGAILSIWPAEIRDGTKLLLRLELRDSGGWVLAFWGVALVWAYLLYRRLNVDHQTEDGRLAEVLRAVHRVPNYQVIVSYPDYFQQAADAIAKTAAAGGTTEETLTAIEAGIQAVLTLIAGMTAEFARASDDTSYGANIMLVARPGQAGTPFDDQLMDGLRFYDRAGGNPSSLLAILYLPQALLLGHMADRPKRTIPLISLPVPHTPKTAAGARLALPGAPWALLTGTQSMEEDTRDMATECADFAKPIISEIDRDFGEGGGGRDVRSFVSYRIGDEIAPVGVLNIDSNHTFVLGPEPEYYASFYALVTPLLRLLRKPVTQYAQLSSSQGHFLSRSAAIARSGNGTGTSGTQSLAVS